MISKTKLDSSSFPAGQFLLDDYIKPFRIDRSRMRIALV